jgi:hypothetical protein
VISGPIYSCQVKSVKCAIRYAEDFQCARRVWCATKSVSIQDSLLSRSGMGGIRGGEDLVENTDILLNRSR